MSEMRMRLTTIILILLIALSSVVSADTRSRDTELGRKAAEEVLNHIGRYFDARQEERVREIMERLVAVPLVRDSGYDFEVQLLNVDEVNAFALPGGFIFVFKGLLFEANDDELAGVLAHEIVHVTHRHAAKQGKVSVNSLIAQALIMLAAQSGEAVLGAQMVSQAFQEQYGRDAEVDADKTGILIADHAGYDPSGYLSFFRRMQALALTRPSLLDNYFTIHPPFPDRIDKAKGEMAKLGLEYRDKYFTTARSRMGFATAENSGGGHSVLFYLGDGPLERFTLAEGAKLDEARIRKDIETLQGLLGDGLKEYEMTAWTSEDYSFLKVRGHALFKFTVEVCPSHAVEMERFAENMKFALWKDVSGRRIDTR